MSQRIAPDDLPFPPPPAGIKFACASLDWPSHFQLRAPSANPASVRSPQRHYPTCSLEHMMTLDVRSFLTSDAFVFLWMTGPHLAIGSHVRLAEAWRLKISSLMFVWVKTKRNFDMRILERSPLMEEDCHLNTGFTSQQNAEFVVLLRRGSPRRLRPVRQMIIDPVLDHSRKPDKFFKRCEAFCEGPRIDMFAGAERPGWTSWGRPHREGERGASL